MKIYLIIFILLIFPVMVSYGESNEQHIPDVNKPSVQIYFGVPSLSWSSAIPIFIEAPSWNADEYKLDKIGNDPQHPITIYTKEARFESVILTETTPDSGKFYALFRCTGFIHDANGDGVADQLPVSGQLSNKLGGIQCGREDGVTVAWRVTDDYTVSASIPVSWNVGQVRFEKDSYNMDESVKFTIIDPDMTLLPFNLAMFSTTSVVEVNVYSDSDAAGIMTTATEINVAYGIFDGYITLSEKETSSGDRLRASPGDKIYLRYTDRTLPDPYSVNDEKEIIGVSKVWHPNMQFDIITQQTLTILDQNRNTLTELKQGDKVTIFSDLRNNTPDSQQFINLIQITDQTGRVVSLKWSSSAISPQGSVDVSHPWIIESPEKYKIESFVWDSLGNMNPISPTNSFDVIATKN